MPRPKPKERLGDHYDFFPIPIRLSPEIQELLLESLDLDILVEPKKCKNALSKISRELGSYSSHQKYWDNFPTPKECAVEIENLSKSAGDLLERIQNLNKETETEFSLFHSVGPTKTEIEEWRESSKKYLNSNPANDFPDQPYYGWPGNDHLEEEEKNRRRILPGLPHLEELRDQLKSIVLRSEQFVEYYSKISQKGGKQPNAIGTLVYELSQIFNQYRENSHSEPEYKDSLKEFIYFSLDAAGITCSRKTIERIMAQKGILI